jgi:cell division protease FtsH
MSQPSYNRDSRNKPGRNGPPERVSMKLLLIWLGVVAVVVFLFTLGGGGGGGGSGSGAGGAGGAGGDAKASVHELKASQVINYLREKKIYSISIEQSPEGGQRYYKISGHLAKPDPDKPESPVGKGERFHAAGFLAEKDFDTIRSNVEPSRVEEKPAATLTGVLLANTLPTLLIFGILAFFAFQFVKNAKSAAFGFAQSRAKRLNRDKQKATFKDVAGCDEAKEDVQEIVEFLRDPKKFQNIGGRIPKGILLVGPPGTGKTLLARAVAGEANVPFFTISGSDFVEMFVGIGAARVRDMFEQARRSAPCILFIDEIDAVGRKRGGFGGGGHDEREQTLNSLLVEMDGFEGHEGIIIIAATNRPDVLDAALLRPGRFDRQVYVDLPDIHGREEILQVHAKKIKLSPSVEMLRVARATSGFSGADLANLLNEAALRAARKNKKEVGPDDLEDARDKISFGSERKRLMDEEDRRQTAYHEAGHAIVQACLDDKQLVLHKVTIIPRGRALGMAMLAPVKDSLGQSKKQLLNRICMAMAGRIGEEIVTGDFSNGASSDIKQATAIARHMVCDWGMSDLGPVALGELREQMLFGGETARAQNYSDETARRIDAAVYDIIVAQYKRAGEIVGQHAAAHRVVAEALLEYETLDGLHVHEALKCGEIRTAVLYRPLTRRENTPGAVEAPPPLDTFPIASQNL